MDGAAWEGDDRQGNGLAVATRRAFSFPLTLFGAVRRMTLQKYRYTQEKLWEAIDALVGEGSIQDRLGYAFVLLRRLSPEQDFPDHLREQFSALMADLEKRAITYRYRPMRINTRHPKSGRMANTILELYTSLRGGISG